MNAFRRKISHLQLIKVTLTASLFLDVSGFVSKFYARWHMTIVVYGTNRTLRYAYMFFFMFTFNIFTGLFIVAAFYFSYRFVVFKNHAQTNKNGFDYNDTHV